MNYLEFKSYVTNISSPEYVDLIDRFNDVVNNYKFNDYLLEMDDIVLADSQASDVDNLDAITSAVMGALDSIILSLGVQTTDEATMDELITICEGMYDIQFYNNKAEVKNITEADETNEEKLSLLLEAVTDYAATRFMSFITGVSDSTIESVTKIALAFDDLTVSVISMNMYSKKIIRYKKLKTILNGKDLYSDGFLNTIKSINLSFSEYLSSYIKNQDPNSELDIRQVVFDLIGMSIVSSSDQQIERDVQMGIGEMVSDASLTPKMIVILNEVLKRLNTSE